jgi:hypothetical protein
MKSMLRANGLWRITDAGVCVLHRPDGSIKVDTKLHLPIDEVETTREFLKRNNKHI